MTSSDGWNDSPGGICPLQRRASAGAVGRPVLQLRARDDAEVPFDNAFSIAAELPTVRLEAADGLGHRAILGAPPALRTAAAFLGGVIEVG